MKTLLTILALGAASPALACQGATTANVIGSTGHFDIFAGKCATSLNVTGGTGGAHFDTTRAYGQTSLNTVLSNSDIVLRNRGGDMAVFAGACPPGMSHPTVDNRSSGRQALVLRCQ